MFSQIPLQGFPKDSNQYKNKKELRIVGSGGLTFNTTQKYGGLFFNMKGFSIYVQTDKGVYKPSQTGKVHFEIKTSTTVVMVHGLWAIFKALVSKGMCEAA